MARFDRRPSRMRTAMVALLLAAPAATLVACNGILGLSDFEKGECAGRCPDPNDVEASVDASADADADTGIDAGKGADPVSWAAWEMPNYRTDGGTALPRLPSYTNAPGAVVTDATTGLKWLTAPIAGEFTIEEAVAACANAEGGGWRLPKRIELVTLLDYSGASAIFIDAVAFPGVRNFQYWTSSEVRPYVGGDTQPYWVVNFGNGSVEKLRGDLSAKALCVRGK